MKSSVNGESVVTQRILLPFISAFAREVDVDPAAMEDEIRRSTTERTIVRPPKLMNKVAESRDPGRPGRLVGVRPSAARWPRRSTG